MQIKIEYSQMRQTRVERMLLVFLSVGMSRWESISGTHTGEVPRYFRPRLKKHNSALLNSRKRPVSVVG